MKISRLFVSFCFLVVVTVAATSHSLAQSKLGIEERSNGALPPAEPIRPSLWDASVDMTWMAGSRIHDNGGDLKMQVVETGLARQFNIGPRIELSTGLGYSLLHLDAPASARLPESLHALSVSIGCEYRLTDNLALTFKVSPGLSSDLKVIDTDDIRVKIALFARYQIFARLSLFGGVAYTAGDNEFPLHPIAGALYQASEKWIFAVGVPRTAVVFKPDKETECYIGGEFYGGEYQLHDTSLGADSINYSDYRLVAGVKLPLSRVVTLGVSGGYAFAREFDFNDGNRADIHVDSAPFGRLEVRFAW